MGIRSHDGITTRVLATCVWGATAAFMSCAPQPVLARTTSEQLMRTPENAMRAASDDATGFGVDASVVGANDDNFAVDKNDSGIDDGRNPTTDVDGAVDSAASSAGFLCNVNPHACIVDAVTTLGALDNEAQLATPVVIMRAEWVDHPFSADPWTAGGGQDAGVGDGHYYQLVALQLDGIGNSDGGIAYAVSLCDLDVIDEIYHDGEPAGTTRDWRAIEDICMWLTGTIAHYFDLRYDVLTMTGYEYKPHNSDLSVPFFALGQYAEWANRSFTATNGAWTHIDPDNAFGYIDQNGNYLTNVGGAVGIRRLNVTLEPKTREHSVAVRHENADGSWGAYETVRSLGRCFGATVPAWNLAANETYQAASVDAYVAGLRGEETVRFVDVFRRRATNTIYARYQEADGSFGEPVLVSTGSDRVGETRTWTREADETYQAATATLVGTDEAQNLKVTVLRRTCEATFDPCGGTGGGIVSKLVGSSYGNDLPAATREGFSFDGWFTEPDGGERVDADTPVSDATLYAHWTAVPQLRLSVPVAIHYLANSDGSLVGPANDTVAITNTGDADAIVSGIHAEAADGLAFVGASPGPGELALTLTPAGGHGDSLGAYACGPTAPSFPDDWHIGAGERLYLNDLAGHLGAHASFDGSSVGTIHWTFAPMSRDATQGSPTNAQMTAPDVHGAGRL